ncbi:Bug family tripartite tricarboxylate transporter substrate binding protein [Propionivibrio sp.]|uniref:Bug family tripartite tricarboxylate transporter substrate binding protein n=1 Tax=Propionivibrio sp. TaxID=2212460 RepID=UPI00272E857E|nr:tripartite tricarboxylate transporter substrate binding protein [Propionivibrio sp.]
MKRMIGFTLVAASLALVNVASAQSDVKWPTKPVQVIVPAGAGGDTDFNARQVARFFEKITGKSMIVTNVKGGSGSIGTGQVKSAAPDGNTILFAHTGLLVVNEVSGMNDYSYEAFDISCIPAVDKGNVLVASKKSGLKSVQEVIDKAKAQPNTIVYGTEMGGFSHLQGLVFQKLAGIQLKIVDAGSASEKIVSLLGGRNDLGAITFGAVKDYAATGEMNIVGQYPNERNPLLGDIKTFREQGVPFGIEKSYLIAFPKGTNPAIVKKMADVMQQISKDPAYAKALEDGFKQPVAFFHTQDALKQLAEVRADFMQYKDLLRQKK